MSRAAVAEAMADDYRRRFPPRSIEMARLYVEQGLTYAQIAEQYGITRQRVGQLLGPMGLVGQQTEQRRALRARELQASYEQVVSGSSTLAAEATRLGYASADSLRDALYSLGLRIARREPAHGTYSRYASRRWRCRCAECKQANRDRQADRQTQDPPTHGASGYVNYGCRCKVCKEAWRLYNRELRRQARQRKEAVIADE